jgi:hypothetical protein
MDNRISKVETAPKAISGTNLNEVNLLCGERRDSL